MNRQPWETDQEKRAFQFFQHITALCLAGDLDAVFWRVLVPQICHTEPAVRHAVLAVSSLHEALFQTPPVPHGSLKSAPAPSTFSRPSDCTTRTTQQCNFALRQYNMAISHLLDEMKTESSGPSCCSLKPSAGSAQRRPVAALITCVLYLCIKMMQGKDKEALIHLEQGRLLLKQLHICQTTASVTGGAGEGRTPGLVAAQQDSAARETDPELAIVRQQLVPLYTRLSLTSFLLGGNSEPIPAHLKTKSVGGFPDTFDSIHSLQAAVHDFLEAVLRSIRRARPLKAEPMATCAAMDPSQSFSATLAMDASMRNGYHSTALFSLFESKSPGPAPNHVGAGSPSHVPESARVHAAVIGSEIEQWLLGDAVSKTDRSRRRVGCPKRFCEYTAKFSPYSRNIIAEKAVFSLG